MTTPRSLSRFACKTPKIADQAIFYLTTSESSPENQDFCVIDDAKILRRGSARATGC
jgi:hypothetical protein